MIDYFVPLIKRICMAAQIELRNNDDGIAVVTMRVAIGKNGKPLMWAVSSCTRLEPVYKVDEFLEAISGEGR